MCPWDRTFLSLISFEVDHLSLLGTVPSFRQYRFEVGQLILPLDRTFLSVIILIVEDRLYPGVLPVRTDWVGQLTISSDRTFLSAVSFLCRSSDYLIGLYQPFDNSILG